MLKSDPLPGPQVPPILKEASNVASFKYIIAVEWLSIQ